MKIFVMNSDTRSWYGGPLSNLCENQEPWEFYTPPVKVSNDHTILYELPYVFNNEPPEPHTNFRADIEFDDTIDYIRLPHSPSSLFVTKDNCVEHRWDVIRKAFSTDISNFDELQYAIKSYNRDMPSFRALRYFIEDVLSEEEQKHFFSHLLPGIIHLALELPDVVPANIPILKKYQSASVSISQMQIATLMANAFLCTLLWHKSTYYVPGANFLRLFAAFDRPSRRNCIFEKLKCILHYFKRVLTAAPCGCVTFERKFISREQLPRWDQLNNSFADTKLHVSTDGTIEDCSGFLQVDFANKCIGGGVLGYGCVQEEIRFVICPELIIGRLFIDQLTDQEAVIVRGCERFSRYTGYGEDFMWAGNINDTTPMDRWGRKKTTIALIDATNYNHASDQFFRSAMLRELNKAYVGFSRPLTKKPVSVAPVASGNWGCGAFNGDIYLKSLIQLMACCAAKRHLVYFSFGNDQFSQQLHEMYSFLAQRSVKVCQLWNCLLAFAASKLSSKHLYSFVQQCYYDSKSNVLDQKDKLKESKIQQIMVQISNKNRTVTQKPNNSNVVRKQDKPLDDSVDISDAYVNIMEDKEQACSHFAETNSRMSDSSVSQMHPISSSMNYKSENDKVFAAMDAFMDGGNLSTHGEHKSSRRSINSATLNIEKKLNDIDKDIMEMMKFVDSSMTSNVTSQPNEIRITSCGDGTAQGASQSSVAQTSYGGTKKRKITDYFGNNH